MVDDHRHHRKAIHLSLSLSLSLSLNDLRARISPEVLRPKKTRKKSKQK